MATSPMIDILFFSLIKTQLNMRRRVSNAKITYPKAGYPCFLTGASCSILIQDKGENHRAFFALKKSSVGPAI